MQNGNLGAATGRLAGWGFSALLLMSAGSAWANSGEEQFSKALSGARESLKPSSGRLTALAQAGKESFRLEASRGSLLGRLGLARFHIAPASQILRLNEWGALTLNDTARYGDAIARHVDRRMHVSASLYIRVTKLPGDPKRVYRLQFKDPPDDGKYENSIALDSGGPGIINLSDGSATVEYKTYIIVPPLARSYLDASRTVKLTISLIDRP